jgi:serine phosphatase RsbU (regulator of sigma subunit)
MSGFFTLERSVVDNKESARKPMEGRRQGKRFLKKRPGLQLRMTTSYVAVSVASALLLELLVVGIWFLVISRLPIAEQNTRNAAERTARIYALQAAVQANGDALNPRSTFQPGQLTSLILPGADSSETVPYTTARSSSSQAPEFALLIAPNGQIVASSYPALYPPSTSAASLLPGQAQLIRNALAGKAGNTGEDTAQGRILSIAQPVLIRENKPIGAIYIQIPSQAFNGSIFSVVPFLLFTGLFWLVLLAPIGAIFGLLTTRGLVRRIHRLVTATGKFASGDYTQRVPTKKQDEIGQLERQFNTMAEQLVESIAQQKSLVEQHARQEERARIEQEMRTAQLIQLSLLPKERPTLSGWRIATYYQAAREVGGDLYDFLPFEDGRLGLVIGDVTDKGMAAALVMASTRSMLRAAALATDSPGKVLARVNDLLYADIPANMFVTCFYAILDPGNGRLRFANAGHDLPYCQRAGSAYELRATGMPLGLMPGMRYEEKEVMLDQNEKILFYTDGLVEAHNPGREMFGFPRLRSLLAEHTDGVSLIDLLLNELKCFTGDEWEQEDDITLLALLRTPE